MAGLLAFTLVANGVSLTTTPAGVSPDGLRLALSGDVSIAVTSWGMLATDTNHAPACAATLIVSLGLLSTPRQAATIVVSNRGRVRRPESGSGTRVRLPVHISDPKA